MGERKGSVEGMVNLWQGRRVFLTGHTGFKGAWLASWLAHRGAQIRGYSLDPPTHPNMFNVASVGSTLEDVRGDIRDQKKLEESVSGFAPEIVFHLAAQPLVRRSYADPIGTYSTNVMGTAHLLEAVRNTPSVRVVICITTDKCYQNREWVWPYRETDALGGHDPYSSSKACAEMVVEAYRDSYFPESRLADHRVVIATARAGNVIGGGDWSEDRLIPDLIRGFQTGEPVRIRRPKSVRPWQHVLEPLHGYMLLAESAWEGNGGVASAFNFGPNSDDVWPVERIATKLAAMWGNGASWIEDSQPGVHEAHHLTLDSSKAQAVLGWRPHLSIETALEYTVDWHRSWQDGANMTHETKMQIARFEQLAR